MILVCTSMYCKISFKVSRFPDCMIYFRLGRLHNSKAVWQNKKRLLLFIISIILYIISIILYIIVFLWFLCVRVCIVLLVLYYILLVLYYILLYFYDSCVYEYVLQNIFQSKPFSRLHDLLSPRPVTKLKSRLTKQETSTTPGIFARENASSPFMMTCGILQKMLRTHI
jgi:hypothetical protein